MHTFAIRLTISKYYYNKLLLEVPSLIEVNKMVHRSNYYANKGISQVDLRALLPNADEEWRPKYYLLLRCNANKIVGNDSFYTLDMSKYTNEDLENALLKRFGEIKEFLFLKDHNVKPHDFTMARNDNAIDLFVDTPKLYIYLCNMGFPYNYRNMVRKK